MTLSGGQRARLGCARAVYDKDVEIYFLDDPLSALDVKVGRHLFDNCIRGLLKSKTVFIVTHQLQYIQHCDQVLVMESGQVVDQGSYEQVCESGKSKFSQAIREYGGGEDVNDAVDDYMEGQDQGTTAENLGNLMETSEKKGLLDLRIDDDVKKKLVVVPTAAASAFGQEMSQEKAVTGNVGWSTYYRYFRAGASMLTGVVLIASLIVGEVAQVITDWYGIM